MVTGRPKIIRRLRRISRLARNGIRIPRATLLDTIKPTQCGAGASSGASLTPTIRGPFGNSTNVEPGLCCSILTGVIQVQVDRISRIIAICAFTQPDIIASCFSHGHACALERAADALHCTRIPVVSRRRLDALVYSSSPLLQVLKSTRGVNKFCQVSYSSLSVSFSGRVS